MAKEKIDNAIEKMEEQISKLQSELSKDSKGGRKKAIDYMSSQLEMLKGLKKKRSK